MSELREKIAQAIAPDLWDKPTLLDVTSTRNFMRARADRILAVIEAEHRIAPREPTEEMVSVGREAILARECVGPSWTLGQHVDEGGYSVPLPPHERESTQLSKAAWALLVYRAMIGAAPKVTK